MTIAPIRIAAPGKIVLWGEYAVLAEAPAAVLALDRYAEVSLSPNELFSTFTAEGFLAAGVDATLIENEASTAPLFSLAPCV